MVHIDIFSKNDTVVQIAHCSFDVHVQDTMGTLVIGATLVMLRPKGNINFDYLNKIMKEKQITCISTVPSLLYSYFTFLQQTNHLNDMVCLRSVCTGGMCSPKK